MKSKKTDIVIASLEFARERFIYGKATIKAEFSNFLVENGYIPRAEVDNNKHLITVLYEQIFSSQDPDYSLPVRFMNMNSYLGLVDYEELQLAREDSSRARQEAKQAIQNAEEAIHLTKKALFWTKISVIIATAVGLVQIIVSFISK